MRHIFVTALLTAAASLQGPTPEAIVDRAAAGGFSGVVLAVRDGATVLERASGTRNDPASTPFQTSTPFAIASVTKQFTRAAMLVLEQQGRLSLADPVFRYVPELPADKAQITLQQIFDMQAGFHEYHDAGGNIPGDHQPMTRDEAIAVIGKQRLHFTPGTDRRYSNSGYTLLAVVIERVSGKTFDAFVRESLLGPSGMRDTGFYGEARWRGRVSRGGGPARYLDNDPAAWPTPRWTLIGSGGMVSTAGDLAKWVRALHSGRLLDASRLQRMYPREEWAFYAGGSSFGNYTTVLEFDRGRDFVIVHSNRGAAAATLAGEVAEAMRGAPLPDGMKQALGARRETTTTSQTQTDGGDEVRLPGGADTPAKRAARALLAALRDGSDEALTAFAEESLSPALRAAMPMPDRLAELRRIGEVMRASGRLRIVPEGEHRASIVMEGGEGMVVTLSIAATAPGHIETLTVGRQVFIPAERPLAATRLP